mmetsp:Transcript_29560/g.43618  ORF Transcript_29560/g.43618 Transcript_29560/m.43618 type:complete len:82 (-) Transcript_29560:414-659(-)
MTMREAPPRPSKWCFIMLQESTKRAGWNGEIVKTRYSMFRKTRTNSFAVITKHKLSLAFSSLLPNLLRVLSTEHAAHVLLV